MVLAKPTDSFNSAQFMFSLCGGKRDEKGVVNISEFLGTGFLINEQGGLVTCGHVVDELTNGDELFAVPDNTRPYLVTEIRRHPAMDVAVCKLAIDLPSQYLRIVNATLVGGIDVLGYGKIVEYLTDIRRTVKGYIFKGNTVRVHEEAELPNTRSVCEVSFPILNGMSGGPLLFHGEREPTVCGMLYGNRETSIVSHKVEEREEDGTRYYERVDRIVELGCAHSPSDLSCFLQELETRCHLRQL